MKLKKIIVGLAIASCAFCFTAAVGLTNVKADDSDDGKTFEQMVNSLTPKQKEEIKKNGYTVILSPEAKENGVTATREVIE